MIMCLYLSYLTHFSEFMGRNLHYVNSANSSTKSEVTISQQYQ